MGASEKTKSPFHFSGYAAICRALFAILCASVISPQALEANIDCAGRLSVVVNAFSSGNRFAPNFKEMGDEGSIHIQTYRDGDLPEFADRSFVRSDFSERLYWGYDDPSSQAAVKARLQQLKERIHLVVAGSDPGVIAADQIAEFLGVAGNDPATSVQRVDKYAMNQAVIRAGLPSLAQYRILNDSDASLDDQFKTFQRWHRRLSREQRSRFVVKPVRSAGTDQVTISGRMSKIHKGVFDVMNGKNNNLGNPNEGAALQQFAPGDEYVVELIASGGEFRLGYILHYEDVATSPTSILHHTIELLPRGFEHEQLLFRAARNFAAANGLAYGVGHIEVKMKDGHWFFKLLNWKRTPDSPKLIEINPRPGGGQLPDMVLKASGFNEYKMIYLALTDTDAFLKAMDSFDWSKMQSAFQISIRAKTGGQRLKHGFYEDLLSLEGVDSVDPHVEEGEIAPRTESFIDVVTDLDLLHPSREVNRRTLRAIRKMEAKQSFLERP